MSVSDDDVTRRRAAEAGLDVKRFDSCLDSGRLAPVWERDRAEGVRLGVTATPTFFINGRMVRGAVPLTAFTEIIDEELDRARGAQRFALR
jgi:predicted DsbA family dithiol-disulfide isomerase